MKCELCPHSCELAGAAAGFCGVRGSTHFGIEYLYYGHITSLALDPIEKKPLRNFYPGSMILSAGSFGCNMRCPFCQNHSISMPDGNVKVSEYSPASLLREAVNLIPAGNIGVAFTYNEPLIAYEFIMDTAKLFKENNLKTILVTNGFINEKPLIDLLPFIDAANIDLKCFSDNFYKELSGDLNVVKRTIELANQAGVHIEVTTLVIPGKNDSADEIGALSAWLGSVNRSIPLHLSRYFPRYKYNENATSPQKLHELADIAKQYLYTVYIGNI